MKTLSFEKCGCRDLIQFSDPCGKTLLFPYGILSRAFVYCPGLGNTVVSNGVRPNHTAGCTLTEIRYGMSLWKNCQDK